MVSVCVSIPWNWSLQFWHTLQSCGAPGEPHCPFTSAALPHRKHMGWEAWLDMCKSEVHIFVLWYTCCSSRGKEEKSGEGRSMFLFAGAFCLLALLFSVLQPGAAIENQMNSQLLPSNSISGGKQKPATVTGRKRGRGGPGFGRKPFPFLLSPGTIPGEMRLLPSGDAEEEPHLCPAWKHKGMSCLPWAWVVLLFSDAST